MCRMLGIISRKPVPSSYLRDFRVLARKGRVPKGAELGHKDGWGIVYYDGRKPRYLGRQATDAMEDKRYEKACENLDRVQISGVLLAHLRKRSVGSATFENTSPFLRETWCFAHNGTIRDFFAEVEGEREDMTDSERFFRLLLQENERTRGVIEETIGRVIDKVTGIYNYSSLTFLLSDGESLYAYRDVSDREMEDYYGLMYARNDDMVIFTQEPIWKKKWVDVPNKCLVSVNKELRIKSTEFER